jgi:hypothetical protein
MRVSLWLRGWGFEVGKTGGCPQLCEDTPKARLHPSRFGGSELGRDDEGSQTLQRLADALQALLAVGGSSRGAGAGVRLCPQETEGVLEECAPFGSAGHAVGGQQRESLAERKAVSLGAAEQGVLLAAGESAERVGERGADLSPSECGLGVG